MKNYNYQMLYHCSKCKKWLPSTAFYADKRSKSGLTPRCKKCLYLCTKEWRERNNPDRHRYLIYASYLLDGREQLVEWPIFAPYKTTAMNKAMQRMAELGGVHRRIDEVIEMTPEFIEHERGMNSHREGELYEYIGGGRDYYLKTESHYNGENGIRACST